MEGEGQMNELFKKDITMKILSVVLAIIFWLYVLNTLNPYDNKKINIQLRIENEDYLAYNNLKLTNKINKNVEIYVRGRADVVNNILSSDFDASIDLSGINSIYDKFVKINLEHNLKDVNVDMSPNSVKIELENIKTASFPVEFEVKGNPKANYKIINKVVSPEVVEFKNIESLIDTIDVVKTVLDVPKDLDKDFTLKKECTVYNKKGEVITELSKDLSVNIRLEIAKEVPIILNTEGSLGEDYIEIARSTSLEKALIRGNHEILSKISELNTQPLNIENLKGNISTAIAIQLPEGVTLIDTPSEISANLTIEKLESRYFTINEEKIKVFNVASDESLTYIIKDTEIQLGIKGRKIDVAGITLERMDPRIDVNRLGEGTHKIPIKIDLPPDSKPLDLYEVEVVISKKVEKVEKAEKAEKAE